MEPASTRVFDIPELVRLIASHLRKPDLSRLSLTSRSMYARCTPSLYTSLRSYFGHPNSIFQSISSTLALARNVQHIRSLFLDLMDTAYLINCLLEFQETYGRVAGVPYVRPPWLPPSDPRTCQLVALPPLNNLTKLSFYLGDDSVKESSNCRYTIPSYKDRAATLPQACYIIRQNPYLACLDLSYIVIKDPGRIRLLIDTISSLEKLLELSVTIGGFKEHCFSMGSALFFSCPPTLNDLSIFTVPFDMGDQADLGASVEMQNWYLQAKEGDKDQQGNILAAPRRQEPLAKLKYLALWEMDTVVIRQDVLGILEHCPNIEHLSLPPISRKVSGSDLAGIVANICPRVTSITTSEYLESTDNELAFRVMEALPAQQVEKFSCSNCSFRMDDVAARSIIRRHSMTLRELDFAFCGKIQSKAVQTILVVCGGLERFALRQYGTHGGLLINLEDAIEKPWACTRIQRFDLTVGVREQGLDLGNGGLYYRRESPIALTLSEEHLFAMLEKLYTQVGLLTEIRRLDLRLEWLDNEGFPTQDSAYDTNSFPALFSLGDARTNRPGYLHLLAGLKKIQKLRGSVFMDVDETEQTVGWKEVVWMDENWRKLTIAEFFHNQGEEARECFVWLKKQRKHDTIPLMLGYPESYE
ncbi:hypothetical protein EC991_008509 [Linnemannia zychae]|nr:hypothetical protein EC991_008509 [Linnemannia zychae]